jgi:hypothetical protein
VVPPWQSIIVIANRCGVILTTHRLEVILVANRPKTQIDRLFTKYPVITANLMAKFLIAIVAAATALASASTFGPGLPWQPDVWPLPTSSTPLAGAPVVLAPGSFHIAGAGPGAHSAMLAAAIARYSGAGGLIFSWPSAGPARAPASSAAAMMPFTLTVHVASENETLVAITDSPRFEYRSLMIDTARHFLNVSTIFKIVESMVIHKLNVLQVHLTDDQSFPFQSTSHPNLTAVAAFDNASIYTHADIAAIVQHANARGVVVQVELDMPPHCNSWRGVPGFLDQWDLDHHTSSMPDPFHLSDVQGDC